MSGFAIRVQGLGKRYIKNEVLRSSIAAKLGLRARQDENYFWALKDVSFDVRRGEGLGIIGRNGAGKSTLLKIISRVVSPTQGKVELYGRVNSLLEIGTGFQPNLSGRENIFLNASILGMSKAETLAVFRDIVNFSGLENFLDMPVKHYSSGMYSRLAFSVAAHVTGDILALDEVLSVGDAEFRRKCMSRMSTLMQQGDRTILFVSHSMDAVVKFCGSAIWLDQGQLVASGDAEDVIKEYLSQVSALRSTISIPPPPAARPETPAPREVGRDAASGDGQEEDAVHLRKVFLLDSDGNEQDIFSRSERVRIRFEYAILRPTPDVYCVVHIHCAPRKGVPDEVHVFTVTSGEDQARGQVGEYATTAELPSNLFITGQYSATIAIVTPGKPIVRHVKLDRALSFRVIDDADRESVFMLDVVHGVVHPDVAWVTQDIAAERLSLDGDLRDHA